MEKIIDRIEGIIEKQLQDLEAKPVSTSLKLLLFYWIFKKIWNEVKGE